MELEVKVLAASEDAGCLNLMALVLQNQKNVTLIGEASNWRELSSLVTTLQPDVVLLDTDAPGNGAAAVIKTARLKRLPTAFMGLVGEMDVESTLLNQLDAIILKSDPFREMTSTILAVASKGKYSQRGCRPGFKTLFAETRRQYPKPESHQDPPPSSTSHPASKIPPAADRVAPQATYENSHQEAAQSTVEAEPYRPTQATVSRPAWERDANGSMDGSQASSMSGHDDTKATTAGDIATLLQQPSSWPSSGKSGLLETAQQDENSRKHEGPNASETQGEKQSSIVSNGGIKHDKPVSSQFQLHDGDYGTLASRLEAMRAALGSGFTASPPDASTNGSTEAVKPETMAAATGATTETATEAAIKETTEAATEAATEETIEEATVAATEETAELSEEPVDIEPAQNPPAVQPPEDDVESTLKEVLPSAGSIVLIASPFGSFRALGNFQQALERLDGVRSMRVRRFQGGTLYAVIRYAGTIEQLEEQLKDLVQFDPRIIEAKPGSIELRVNATNGHSSDE